MRYKVKSPNREAQPIMRWEANNAIRSNQLLAALQSC
jgi:hypothetical protein